MEMRELTKVIQRHRQRMISHFGNEDVDLLSQEFVQIKKTSREEPYFNKALQDCAARFLGFKNCLVTTSSQFPKLQQLCGGFASAFPNTVQNKLFSTNSTKVESKESWSSPTTVKLQVSYFPVVYRLVVHP